MSSRLAIPLLAGFFAAGAAMAAPPAGLHALTLAPPAAEGSTEEVVVLDANTSHAVTSVDASPVTVLVHHHKDGAR